ncbi:MAG: hypothetical protein IJ287_07975 [Methanobrevibacter sp.]|nr:hypothetical protein [Methanobrevibacter sp.]
MIRHKSIILVSVLLLFLFLTASCVSAVENNMTDELQNDLAGDEIVGEDSDYVKLENSDKNDLMGDDGGYYLDPTEAYERLNEFRLEKGVWFWNGDDTTVTYYNTNEYNQLQPLVRDEALEQTAKIRAKECADLFEHTRPDGTSCFTAYPDYGSGENLARYCDASTCTEMWKETFDVFNDQGHRRSMINPLYTCVGIAGYTSSYGVSFWVQAFGWKDIPTNQTPPAVPVYENRLSFNDLNELIKKSVNIKFDNDYIYQNDSDLTNGIVIDRALTIDGQGHSIDATQFGRIFNISADNVVLKNIVFKNAYVDDCGGAIYSNALNLTVLNCTFDNNFAYYGSALYSKNGGIDLNDCNFIDNMGVQGTVYSVDGKVNVVSSIFEDNYAMLYAGGIYVSNGDFTISDSVFKNNSAFFSGALYVNNAILSMLDCSMENNSALHHGAIYLNNSFATISDSRFKRNSIKDYYFYARGSSIHSDISDLNVMNCNFTDNYAYTGGSVSSLKGNLTMENCNFLNDYSYVDHGVLYLTDSVASVIKSNFLNGRSISQSAAIYSDKSDLKIVDCNLKNYTAEYGSAVYSFSSKIHAVNCNFENTKALSEGTIYSNNDYLIFEGCSFKNCTALEAGGIYLDRSNLTLNDCDFIKNSANAEYESNGGAIYSKEGKISILNSRFMDNSASTVYYYAMGGAIYLTNSEMSLVNSMLTNSSSTIGGAIYLANSSITVSESGFERNNAYAGGVIYSIDSTVLLNITNICNNYLDGRGIIYSENANLDVIDSIFSNNTADYGAAVYSVNGNMTSSNSIFISNTAKSNGGSFFSYNGTVNVLNCNFTGNNVHSDFNSCGGAIYSEDGTLSVLASNFIRNSASDQGGAIYSKGNILVKGCKFIENSANSNNYYAFGAAINENLGEATIVNNLFENNLVNSRYTASGASIYLNDANAYVKDCIFKNENGFTGASIYSENSYFDLKDSSFSDAHAREGGAIYLTNSNSNILNSNFTNSIDCFNGGSIYSMNSNASVLGSNFENNIVSYRGGAVVSSNSNITLRDSTFKNNTAYDGGAVYGCDAIGCTFEDNYATGTAAAIYGDNNIAENCKFIRNTAFSDNPTYNVTVKDSTFEGNRIIKRAQLDIEYLASEYYQGDQLYVSLYSGFYEYINNASVTIKAYKGDKLAGTFEFITGDGWIVNITEGEYLFVFSVEESDYMVTPVNATLKIIKNEIADVKIDAADNTYSEVTVAGITSNVAGSISIYLDDSYCGYLDVEANKRAEFSFGYLPAGNHEIRIVITPSNPRVIQKTFTKSFTVYKKPTSIVVDVLDGVDDKNVIVQLTASEDGTVELKVADIVKQVNVKANVKSSADLGVFAKGSYSVLARFSAGDNFIGSNASKSFKVSAKISQEDIKITPPKEGSKDISISLPRDATGKVTFTIAGENYVIDVVDGVANVRLHDVIGDNPYKITYSGDEQYAGFSISGTYNSDKNITINPDMDVTKFEDGISHVTLPSDATGTVTLTIGGEKYTYDVVKGISTITLPPLANGNYEYVISYSGDGKYLEALQKGNVEIINPSITAANTKVTYAAGAYYQIVVNGYGGKPSGVTQVIIKVKGKNFKTLNTDVNGTCKFKVTQIPGTYKLQISSLGVSKIATLTVKHLMKLKKVTVKKSAKKLVLTATLAKINKKYLKGKKVTFKFNGKKYTAKTDKKGIAKVTIKASVLKKLKVSKKITYQATYLKDTVKYSVKVKK